jgi:hypothetical protein
LLAEHGSVTFASYCESVVADQAEDSTTQTGMETGPSFHPKPRRPEIIPQISPGQILNTLPSWTRSSHWQLLSVSPSGSPRPGADISTGDTTVHPFYSTKLQRIPSVCSWVKDTLSTRSFLVVIVSGTGTRTLSPMSKKAKTPKSWK